MGNWWTDYQKDACAKARLLILKEKGLERIREVNTAPERAPGESFQKSLARSDFQETIQDFRAEVVNSQQLSRLSKLRIEQEKLGQRGAYDLDHTRNILTQMVINIGAEIESIERRTSFRVAIVAICISSFSALVSSASLVWNIVSKLW